MVNFFAREVADQAARNWAERTRFREANAGLSSVEIEGQARVAMRMERLAGAAAATATVNLAASFVPGAEVLRSIGLERVIGQSDFQSIAFLQLALAVSRFVGRINIRSGAKTVGYGTGFMVSPRLLLTNNHVLPTADLAQASTVEFDYQLDKTGNKLEMVPFAFDTRSFFLTDPRLDFTLVAVDERSTTGRELRLYGWSPLIGSQGKVLIGEHVNIVQHPRGDFKQFVSRDNKVVDLLSDFLHYVTDTEPGSSGSPVYNDQWEVVALHRSGVPAMIGGQYQDIDGNVWNGRDPDRIKWVANEGVRVSKLVEFIRGQRLDGFQATLRDQLLFEIPKNPIELAMEAEHSMSEDRPTPSTTGRIELTIPLKISIELGQPAPLTAEPASSITPPVPRQLDALASDPGTLASSATPTSLPPIATDFSTKIDIGAGPTQPVTLEEAMLEILSLDAQQPPPDLAREAVDKFGRYDGLPIKLSEVVAGRARVLKALSFTDAADQNWAVPVGMTTDGASIPRPFWSLIGKPFEGRYVEAALVHDRFCDTRERSWRDTHRVFYAAMRTSGVPAFKAKVMFYAVFRFGPRWRLPASAEASPAPIDQRPATSADAPTILADAEAIFAHDLSIEEIANLAEARNVQPIATREREFVGAGGLERVRRLVVTGGSGTAADLESVAAAAAGLPVYVMDRFERKKIRIIACRSSITDFETSLKGKVPRGWEGLGRTWDDVPGVYLNERKRVVIGTVAGPAGARIIPGSDSGKHGSASLVIHEALHGYDYAGDHAEIREARFIQARDRSIAALDAYQRQPGQAGLEETFAESGARFITEPHTQEASTPELFRYWRNRRGREDLVIESLDLVQEAQTEAIGSFVREADGTVLLDLRAEGDGGIVGHAMLTITKTDESYDRILAHLDLSLLDAAEATTGEQNGLVRPLARRASERHQSGPRGADRETNDGK